MKFGLGFLKRRVKQVEIPPGADPLLFHQSWERKRLPGPGAMNYAYESQALAPFPVAGPTIAVRQPRAVFQGQQSMVLQSVSIAGVPTQAGQVLAQPLFDPQTGTATGLQPQNPLPYQKHGIQPAGSIF